MKVLFHVLKALSTQQQGNLIKRMIEETGYGCEYKKTISVFDIRDKDNVAFMWFTLGLVPFLGDAVWPFIYATKTVKKPALIYVTVEGTPLKGTTLNSNIPKLGIIANSQFSAACLRKVGIEVKGVIHHGLDLDLCNEAFKQSSILKEKLEKQYPNQCKMVYVGRNDPRKRLDLLSVAVNILNKRHKKDYVVLLHTDSTAKKLFNQENVVFHGTPGSVNYLEILMLMAACDYLVFPTVCEGFGLPLLEANGVGTPAIHAWFAPLSEFSSKDFNFVFDYDEQQLVRNKDRQNWVFHNYAPESLADMMKYAIDVWKKKPKKYQEYCTMAREHTKAWDYKKIYAPLLGMLNLVQPKTKLEEAHLKW